MTGAALVVQGDALHLPLPDGSVDLAISSPPYFNLRSYGAGPGEIGSERTPAEFLEALWAATRELVRVLKPTGSIFINLGDKYAGGGGGNYGTGKSVKGREGAHLTNVSNRGYWLAASGVQAKSLLGLPWAYALGCTGMLANLTRGMVPIEMLERTFRPHMTELDIAAAFQAVRDVGALGGPDPGLNLILRAPIVLHKINGLPESVRDRVRTSDQEMLFHLVKQPRYYSALDELREPHTAERDRSAQLRQRSPKPGDVRPSFALDGSGYNPLGKLPGSVWSMASEPLRLPEWLGVNHYAAFSSELPRRVVLAFSPPGICVECGAGRVPVVERQASGAVRNDHGMGARHTDQAAAFDMGNRTAADRSAWQEGVTATILGYACSCTPFTDHPGSEDTYFRGGGHPTRGLAVERKSPIPHVARGDEGPIQRTGPWREYHLDGWRPPPTRPAIVADVFGGTGTTAMVARALGRIGVSIDLSHSYSRAARWRVHHDAGKAISRTWVERQGSLL
jgi:SAM-dependent methyltransferase